MLSLSQHDQLAGLEKRALSQLKEIDLMTPMRQIRHGLDALLDIPTTVRASNTTFSQQALTEIVALAGEAQQLSLAVQGLMEHVSRTSPVRVEAGSALSMAGE